MLVRIVAVDNALGIGAEPVVAGDGPAGLMADFLTSDLQGSSERTLDVMHHLEAVQSGRETAWSVSGNAYLLTLRPDAARLDCHWADEGDPETAMVPLEALRQGLEAWLAALERVPAPKLAVRA